ncbi:hypothetical protein S7335_1147 [Synechococcus sp. PCC 7335]|uniref:hypothetical protein n=1 Tax=Synechococcus sp. (strain ATCC 29403 / PCC 7335) TaxID=91464 RepID=UPI00017EB934|nr:hypothetical protein [Synechococcus sp. PCC 7335]EDX82443.1 hypothetical protein S7335_1147 [Synechococcus sp. PCC 7335]
MVPRKARARILLVVLSSALALSLSAFLPASAPAAEIIREAIEGVFNSDEEEEEWYIPGVRRYRCQLIHETPAPADSEFKTCAYNCRGYGAGATFPWPKDLPCPGGFNHLMPEIPEGYPSPYPSNPGTQAIQE